MPRGFTTKYAQTAGDYDYGQILQHVFGSYLLIDYVPCYTAYKDVTTL